MDYRKFDYDRVRALSEQVFEWYQFSKEEAETITDVLLTSNLYGIESHGVQRLTLYPYGIDIGRIKVEAKAEIVQETPVSALIDAHECMGQLSGTMAMKLAIEKAQKTGIGMTLVKKLQPLWNRRVLFHDGSQGRIAGHLHDQHGGPGSPNLRKTPDHGHQPHRGNHAGRSCIFSYGHVNQCGHGGQDGGLRQK